MDVLTVWFENGGPVIIEMEDLNVWFLNSETGIAGGMLPCSPDTTLVVCAGGIPIGVISGHERAHLKYAPPR